jgi:hypothetical protein
MFKTRRVRLLIQFETRKHVRSTTDKYSAKSGRVTSFFTLRLILYFFFLLIACTIKVTGRRRMSDGGQMFFPMSLQIA